MNEKICRKCRINAILEATKVAVLEPNFSVPNFSVVRFNCKEDKDGNLPEFCPYAVEQVVSKTKDAK